MDELYRDIFNIAESCRREGIDGMAINPAEYLRQKSALVDCVEKVITEMRSSFSDYAGNDDDTIAATFSYALKKYIIKYSIFDKSSFGAEGSLIEDYCCHGDDLKKRSAEILDPTCDVTSNHHNFLDKLREYCFVFCLVSIDVYAPTVSIESKINKAVVFDSLKDGASLKAVCEKINEFHKMERNISADLLWECGNLNYKIGEYDIAREYFYSYIEECLKNAERTQSNRNDILDAFYRIAYCHEFNNPNNVSMALYIYAKIILLNDSDAYAKFQISSINEIRDKWIPTDEQSKKELARIDSLIDNCVIPSNDWNKNNIELFHGISHLLNELVLYYPKVQDAPPCLTKNNPKILLRIASRLMYAAACRKPLFFTCLGTNHSENREFDNAITIFNFILTKLLTDGKKDIHLRMEVIFYLAHAYLYAGKYAEAEKQLNEFKKYCELLNDKEGFAHLAIYNVFLMLNKASSHFDISSNMIKSALSQLSEYEPSVYTTKKIQIEWRRLTDFLTALLALKELFEDSTSDTLALKTAIKSVSRCSDNEYLLNKLPFTRHKKDGYEFARIHNGKCSDDVIYYLNDNIVLQDDLFTEEKTESQNDFALPISDKSVPIIVFTKNDAESINWLKNVLLGRTFCLYVSAEIYNELSDFSQATGSDIIPIFDVNVQNILKYAYLHLAYNAITRSFFEPRAFLGLAPTKMTQFMYKFNIRKINTLYEPRSKNDQVPMSEIQNKFQSISTMQKIEYGKNYLKESEKMLFQQLCKIAENHSESENIIASIYLPLPKSGSHWYYNISDTLLSPGLPAVYTDDRRIIDVNNFYCEFTNKPHSKDPYHPGEKITRDFLNKNVKRQFDVTHDCGWIRKTNCAHVLIQPIVHQSDNENFRFVENLLQTILLFDTNSNKVDSMLLVRLNTHAFFIILFNKAVDSSTWHNTAKQLVEYFYNATLEKSVMRTQTASINLTGKDKIDERKVITSMQNTNPTSTSQNKKFKIGVSFCGEHRASSVLPVLNHLVDGVEFTKENVFYDKWHPVLINSASKADVKIKKIYSEQCDLVVVFLSKEYNSKPWTGGIEWTAVREVINQTDKTDTVFLLNVDDVDINKIDGLSSITAIATKMSEYTAEEIARFIKEKFDLL